MPIYCFICEKCGNKIEDLRNLGDTLPPICSCSNKIKLMVMNYSEQKPVMLDDIPSYFDKSINQWVNGRRDKATKYRNGGYTMIGANHGGDVTMPEKRLYGDEEYEEKVYGKTPEQEASDRYLELMVDKGIEDSKLEPESFCDVGNKASK